MTEAEWLSCGDPWPMLQDVRGRASERKLRLVGCACCRTVWPLLRRASRRAVEAAEALADAVGTAEDRDQAVRPAIDVVCLDLAGRYEVAADMAYKVALN